MKADRVAVVDNGAIVELGTHDGQVHAVAAAPPDETSSKREAPGSPELPW